jgi:hypothetical protein
MAKLKYGEFDNDVLDTARSIQKARNVSDTKRKAIKDALRASK